MIKPISLSETIDTMFSRFQSIMNKMYANKAQLPYDDHERALKLLHALDRREHIM
jgi:hypothetical protein